MDFGSQAVQEAERLLSPGDVESSGSEAPSTGAPREKGGSPAAPQRPAFRSLGPQPRRHREKWHLVSRWSGVDGARLQGVWFSLLSAFLRRCVGCFVGLECVLLHRVQGAVQFAVSGAWETAPIWPSLSLSRRLPFGSSTGPRLPELRCLSGQWGRSCDSKKGEFLKLLGAEGALLCLTRAAHCLLLREHLMLAALSLTVPD